MTTAKSKATTSQAARKASKRRVTPKWVAVPTNLEDIFRAKQLAGETGTQSWVVSAAMALAVSSLSNDGKISRLPSELKRITGGRIGVIKALGTILGPHPSDERYLCIPELIEPLTDAANSAGKRLDGTDLSDEEFDEAKAQWKRNVDRPNRAYDFPATPQETAKAVPTIYNPPTSVISSSLRSEQITEVRGSTRGRKEKGTPFPDGWKFGEEELAAAAARRKTLTDAELQREFQSFEDYSRRKGSVWVDWKAAWRNWVSKAEQFREERAKENNNGMGGVKVRIL